MASPILIPIKPIEDDRPPRNLSSAGVHTVDSGTLLAQTEHETPVLTKAVSEGSKLSGCGEEENPELELRWPVRRFSASSDPVTKARRRERLGTIIQKAKQRGHRYRTHAESPPAEDEAIDDMPAVASPPRRRSSLAGAPRFLWYHNTGDIFRRAAHATSRHIRSRSRPVTGSEMPNPGDEEEPASGHRGTQTDPTNASPPEGSPLGGSSPEEKAKRRKHHIRDIPPLHLWVHRTESNSPPVTSAHLDTPPSPSSAGSRSGSKSAKSARADTAVTVADVHVWSPSHSLADPEDSTTSLLLERRSSTTSSSQFVESVHGAYEVVWEDPTPSRLRDEVYDAADESEESPPVPKVGRSSSWSTFANSSKDQVDPSFAGNVADLARSRSHPRFRPYVEVYQDEEPTFDLDDDGLMMAAAPPNSKRTSLRNLRRPSRHSSEDSPEPSPSPSSSSPASPATDSEPDEFPLRENSSLSIPSLPTRPDSPRPRHNSDGSLNPRCRNLSNLPDEAAALTRNHRDSFTLTRERYTDYPLDDTPFPHDAPYLHRDSVAIAKDRIRKRHGQAVTAISAPVDIPRYAGAPQISFVGGLSPILDFSPRSHSEPPNIAELTQHMAAPEAKRAG